MIGPVYDFADLGLAGRSPCSPPGIPDQSTIDAHVLAVGPLLGVDFQPENATGRDFRGMTRVPRYVLARPDEVLAAASAIVDSVARDHGMGRAWGLAGIVHVICEDSPPVPRSVAIDGVPHVVVRSWICHENGPRFDEYTPRRRPWAAGGGPMSTARPLADLPLAPSLCRAPSPDPLVAGLIAAVDRDEAVTEKATRLSAVLAAARALVDAEDRPRTCPPEVRALRAALSAADGAR